MNILQWLTDKFHQLMEKFDHGPASYKTAIGVGTAAAVVSGWQQWVLFVLAVLIALARLAFDGLKLYRLWKNKRATG
jgi:hypothetical protein